MKVAARGSKRRAGPGKIVSRKERLPAFFRHEFNLRSHPVTHVRVGQDRETLVALAVRRQAGQRRRKLVDRAWRAGRREGWLYPGRGPCPSR